MRTTREEWELDGFRVAIDHTLFGSWLWGKAIYPQRPFCTGKVELSRDWSTSETKKLDAQDMDRRIDAFLKQHQDTFPANDGGLDEKSEAFKKWMHAHIEKMCKGVRTSDELQSQGMYDD